MIFILDRFGTVTSQIQPPIYQGSVGIDTMQILAPFPSTAICSIAAVLPNGGYIEPRVVGGGGEQATPHTIEGVRTADGAKYSLWVWKPDARITQYAGLVRVQFAFYAGGAKLATSDVTFRVDGGVPYITPSVSEADYDTIAQLVALASQSASKAQEYAALAREYADGTIILDPDIEGSGVIVDKWAYFSRLGETYLGWLATFNVSATAGKWDINLTKEGEQNVAILAQSLEDWGITYSGTAPFTITLNDGHNADNAKEYKEEAEIAKVEAEAAAERAERAAGTATNEATAAEGYKDQAEAAAERAEEAVENISVIGRYLSNWDCDAGEAMSDPAESPYAYKRGDYFIIGKATEGVTHYRPKGDEYDVDDPERDVETADVKLNDVYFYDGTSWLLQVNAPRDTSFASITGSPSENDALDAYFVKSSAVSEEALGGSVVKRTGGTQINTGTPTNDSHAVNLEFLRAHSVYTAKHSFSEKYLHFTSEGRIDIADDFDNSNIVLLGGERLYFSIHLAERVLISQGASVDMCLVAAGANALVTIKGEYVTYDEEMMPTVTVLREVRYSLESGANYISFALDQIFYDRRELEKGGLLTIIIDVDQTSGTTLSSNSIIGGNRYASSVFFNFSGLASKVASKDDFLYGHAEQKDAQGNIIPHGKERIYPLAKNGERKPFSVLFSNGNGDMAVPDARDKSDTSKEAVNIKTLRDLTYKLSLPSAWYNSDVIPGLRQDGTDVKQITLYVRENVGGGFIPKRKNDEGNIPVPLVPRAGNDAASKQYVDNAVGSTVTANSNKTVNGYSVPVLTDAQLLTIYNATVAGKSISITDATGKMHFSGVTADMVDGDVFVSFLYFDKMVLEYGEGNVTNFTALGGGGGGAPGELITSFTFANDREKFVSLGGEYKRVFIEFEHTSSDYEDEFIYVTTELTLAAQMLLATAPVVPIQFIDHRGFASCLIDVSTGSTVMIGTEQSDIAYVAQGVTMATKALAQDSISYVRFIGSANRYYDPNTIPSSISVKIYGVK